MRVVLLSVAYALAAYGADISGIWTGEVPGRNGGVQDVTFQFKQRGETVAGKLYGDDEDIPIADGALSGSAISFSVSLGAGSNKSKFLYSGTVDGAIMRLTRQRENPEPQAPDSKRNTPQSITLRRMT